MKIEFDYRFDTNGFFASADRRQALEKAADIWENLLKDDFDNVLAGTKFSIRNPQTGNIENITLTSAIDDLLIFVGSRNLPNNTLARAGYDGVDAAGDIYSVRISNNFRGTGVVTNFEPWAGIMYFDSDTNWSFNLQNPEPNKVDFISIALHEMGHVLGLGTAPVFTNLGSGGLFYGVNALNVNNGNPIPLENDLTHVEEGFNDNTVLIDPIYNGDRSLPTNIDLALLADIGYEITGFTTQGFTPAIVTPNNDVTVFGTILPDLIDALGANDKGLGNDGDDTLLGNTGNDTLFGENGNDSLSGGSGDDQLQGSNGNDTLSGDSGNDILFGENGNDWLKGGDNNDQLQGGNDNDTLEGNSGNDLLFGQENNDLLIGGDNDDQLQGGNGNDTLEGGKGNDVLFGETGQDRFIFNLNSGEDTINDFTVTQDQILISSEYGFNSPTQILNAITSTGNVTNNAPHSRFSVISLTTQDEITVFHDNNLVTNNFVIINNAPPASLDIDGDGQYLASVDGLLFYGYLNIRGISVPSLVNNLTQQLADSLINPNSGATRTTGTEIANYLETNQIMMDVDGDGTISAAIDGLLTYGYLNIYNLPPSLVNNLTQQLADNLIPDNSGAIRTTGSEISAFLKGFIV